MSCIRFNTPAQRQQLAANAPTMRTPEEVARHYRSPEWTESKLRRLRVLAQSENPRIRERVAADYHTPDDVVATLAKDPDAGVRATLARNETVSCDILRDLAHDESETVRGFVAVNFFVPEDAMAELAEDDSPVVRRLVAWKTQLASESAAESEASAQELLEA